MNGDTETRDGIAKSGGVMLWILNKPKVYLLRKPRGLWYYTFKDGVAKAGSEILLSLMLQNKGVEATSIVIWFEAEFSDSSMKAVYWAKDTIRLQGNLALTRASVSLYLSIDKGQPPEGETLHGLLFLEPVGNRRLIFGRKVLTERIDIPFSDSIIKAKMEYADSLF